MILVGDVVKVKLTPEFEIVTGKGFTVAAFVLDVAEVDAPSATTAKATATDFLNICSPSVAEEKNGESLEK